MVHLNSNSTGDVKAGFSGPLSIDFTTSYVQRTFALVKWTDKQVTLDARSYMYVKFG